MKTSLALRTTVLGAALAVLAGCGSKSTSTSSESSSSAPLADPPLIAPCAPGKPGGRLIINEVGDPKTFNPITANEQSSEDIYRFLFASLLGFDVPTQEVEPGLAESWSVAPDHRTWTFKLRKNLRWSDGAPLTADDVLFTWNDVVVNPKIDNVTRDLYLVDGKVPTVTKVDDLTIQVVTPDVFAPFLESFGAGLPILPKHVLAKFVADGTFASTYGIDWKPSEIVGSGPFRIKEFKPAQYALVERNPYFFEVDTNHQRLPYFDNIVFVVVPDLNAMSLRFLSGESDVDDFIFAHEYDRFKAESAKGRFQLLEPGIGLETTFFFFNQNTNVNPKTGAPVVDRKKLAWFRNTKFRQACSYAIDRDAIVRSLYNGRAIPDYGLVTPGDKKWCNTNTAQYPHDVAKARALLKEIGIQDRNGDGIAEDAKGNPIEFVFNTNTGNNVRDKMAVLIEADLQKLGFKVIYQPIEFNTLVSKINDTHEFDCVLIGLAGGSCEPSSHMNVVKSSGYTHQWFPRQTTPSTDWEARMDYLMDAQMKTIDFGERKKCFDEVQAIWAEQQPLIYTVTPYYYAAIRSDIGNVRATPLTYNRATWNGEELYFKR